MRPLPARHRTRRGTGRRAVANTCSQLKVKLGASNLPGPIRMVIEYLSTAPTERDGDFL
jgi:hypothetical protein